MRHDASIPAELHDGARESVKDALGAFWSSVFRDQELVDAELTARTLSACQAYIDAMEALSLRDHSGMPVFHREHWHPALVRLSRRNTGCGLVLGMEGDPKLGPQPADSVFMDGEVFVLGGNAERSKVVTYPLELPEGCRLVSVRTCICSSISSPAHVLSPGRDFMLRDGILVLRREHDPFEAGGYRIEEDESDRMAVLWLCDAEFDREHVGDFLAYPLGFEVASTPAAARILSALWDVVIYGLTPKHLNLLLGALFEVPTVPEDTVVESTGRELIGFTPFTIVRDGEDITDQVGQPMFPIPGPVEGQLLWDLTYCLLPGDTDIGLAYPDKPGDVLSLTLDALEPGGGYLVTYELSRTPIYARGTTVVTSDAVYRVPSYLLPDYVKDGADLKAGTFLTDELKVYHGLSKDEVQGLVNGGVLPSLEIPPGGVAGVDEPVVLSNINSQLEGEQQDWFKLNDDDSADSPFWQAVRARTTPEERQALCGSLADNEGRVNPLLALGYAMLANTVLVRTTRPLASDPCAAPALAMLRRLMPSYGSLLVVQTGEVGGAGGADDAGGPSESASGLSVRAKARGGAEAVSMADEVGFEVMATADVSDAADACTMSDDVTIRFFPDTEV